MQVGVVNFQASDAGAQFVRALRDTGFVILRNHPLPTELLRKMSCDWQSFFYSQEKYDYLIEERDKNVNAEGYTPADVSETAVGHGLKDLKEFYHLFSCDYMPAELRQDCIDYKTLAFDLGSQLLDWMEAAVPGTFMLDSAESLSSILSKQESLLRVLCYPPLSGTENPGAIRAAAHEDINIITLLPVAEQSGLQVKSQSGQWHSVEGVQGDLIVNSGDMLNELSAGYFVSTTHRVLNPEENSNVARISLPYFLTPNLSQRLSARYTAGQYLQQRLDALSR